MNKGSSYRSESDKGCSGESPLESYSFTVLNQSMADEQSLLNHEDRILNDSILSDSDVEVQDFEEKLYTQNVAFTGKQWFCLVLAEILKPSQQSLTIDLLQNRITGYKPDVCKFYQNAQNQLTSMVIKSIKLKIQIPLHSINSKIQPHWKCQVFDLQTLQKAWQHILNTYQLNRQIKQEIQSIFSKEGMNQSTRFIWVLKDAQDKAIELIKDIYKEEKDKLSSFSHSHTVSVRSKLQTAQNLQDRFSIMRQKKPQNKFIHEIKYLQQKYEQKPHKKILEDLTSDEQDLPSFDINQKSKSTLKKTELKKSNVKEIKNFSYSLLELLEVQSQMSMNEQSEQEQVQHKMKQKLPVTKRRPNMPKNKIKLPIEAFKDKMKQKITLETKRFPFVITNLKKNLNQQQKSTLIALLRELLYYFYQDSLKVQILNDKTVEGILSLNFQNQDERKHFSDEMQAQIRMYHKFTNFFNDYRPFWGVPSGNLILHHYKSDKMNRHHFKQEVDTLFEDKDKWVYYKSKFVKEDEKYFLRLCLLPNKFIDAFEILEKRINESPLKDYASGKKGIVMRAELNRS